MSAEIIQLGGTKKNAAKRKSVPQEGAPQEPTYCKFYFTFEDQEYEARFVDGEFDRLRTIYYRVQNGRRAKCGRDLGYKKTPPEAIVHAAREAFRARQPGTVEAPLAIDAETLATIKRLDKLKRISNWASQQLKSGRPLPDVAAEVEELMQQA